MIVAAIAAVALSAIVVRPCHAQAYPNKPIRLILPYTAGSPNDVLARLVTPALSHELGQNVVIDNRPGGGTSIGARAVMTADPDGYTLLFSNSPVHFIAPAVSKAFTYEPIKDFVPIAAVGTSSNVMVVVPKLPVSTVKEFVAYAKANPGKLNFGYGQGTLPHLIGALFKLETGADFAFVPYKGGAQATTDMLGGRMDLNFGTLSTLLPLIRDGRLKILAVTSAERNADVPDAPTMAEAGYPNVTTVSYYGLFGPRGTPAEIVTRINAAANAALKSPELGAAMAKVNFQPHGGSPDDFSKTLAAEMDKWLPVVKATGFQME
jgi:tripartite-type tricarboxylate transporter receptor subunit TctC